MHFPFLIFWLSGISALTLSGENEYKNSLNSSTQYIYKSFDDGMQCNSSMPIQRPKTVDYLVWLVRYAIRHGYRIKPLGSLHSVTDLICTDGLPISMKGINHTLINLDGTATFGAGIELHDALEFLEKNNLGLIHSPLFGRITVGGAIGTGAHGSSLLHPASISDQVVSLRVIDGSGKLVTISDPEDVNAFRVHLGLLGLIVDVTLRTVPLFKYRVEISPEPESILFDDGSSTALSWARQSDWFELRWFPSLNEVVALKGNIMDVSTPGNAINSLSRNWTLASVTAARELYETQQSTRIQSEAVEMERVKMLGMYSNVQGSRPLFTEADGFTLANPAIGYGPHLQTARCSKCSWDFGNDSMQIEDYSMAVDVSQFSSVFKMIKNVLAQTPASFYMVGLLIRFQKASPSLMGYSSGRDVFTVEWLVPMRVDRYRDAKYGLAAFQAIQQEIVANYGGRSHWGKNGAIFKTVELLAKQHPNRLAFIKAMQKFDPNGLFLNKFGNRIRGISNESDYDPAAAFGRCALQDYCICRNAKECGVGQDCRQINGFHVCKDV